MEHSEITSLPRTPTKLITSNGDIAGLCDHLHSAGAFGVDTEFIGETSYVPILCLIQVSTTERVELIDPQAGGDLGPLLKLVADSAVVKICHAGEQDLEILHHIGGLTPANMFDTQIIAGQIGVGYPLSYGKLVSHFCGVDLEKAHTYSDWSRRPLSPAQFEYAVDDVRYLPLMHQRIDRILKDTGRKHWAQLACDELCESAAAPLEPRDLYRKIKTAKSMQPVQLAVLRDLTAWREQLAFEHNMPARTLMPDNVLRDIAKLLPRHLPQFNQIKDFPRPEVRSYGPAILDLIEAIRQMPESSYPQPDPEPLDTPESRVFGESLWAAAQSICLGQSVCTGVVTSQSQVLALADAVFSGSATDGHPVMRGWRKECLGDTLLNFAQGSQQITLQFKNRKLQSTLL